MVKGCVELVELVLAEIVPLHLHEGRVELCEQRLLCADRGHPHGPGLDCSPELDQAIGAEVAQGQLEAQGMGERVARLATKRHAVVGAVADVDEAQRRDDPQRLPHGRPRHAEARRSFPFRWEPVACRELTVRDRLLQVVEDLSKARRRSTGLMKAGRSPVCGALAIRSSLRFDAFGPTLYLCSQ